MRAKRPRTILTATLGMLALTILLGSTTAAEVTADGDVRVKLLNSGKLDVDLDMWNTSQAPHTVRITIEADGETVYSNSVTVTNSNRERTQDGMTGRLRKNGKVDASYRDSDVDPGGAYDVSVRISSGPQTLANISVTVSPDGRIATAGF
jgi:hypothetical protein